MHVGLHHACLRDTATQMVENRELFLPFLYVATPLNVRESEFRHDLP